MDDSKYKISISLNVLNHLGINLYSSIPAVLSEVVANAWDADATEVYINLDLDDGVVVVTDNGQGMSVDDLNKKYLNVGRQRREEGEALTPVYERPVMGRKGIGKLSLFSIADTVEVHSAQSGSKAGLVMNLQDIREKIKKSDPSEAGEYSPNEVLEQDIEIENGTRIIIRDFRKNIHRTLPHLRTRLARRFAILGARHDFCVKINGDDLTMGDRDYFSKLQYMWAIGNDGAEYLDMATSAEKKDVIVEPLKIDGENVGVSGWIGTFKSAGDAKDSGNENLNKISIMVRGKVAQEDILNELGDAGVYAQYLIGEIHADFLDMDNAEDIATSSRQKLVEDDPRYQELSEYVRSLIGRVRTKWSDYRKDEAERKARQNPAIEEWFDSLGKDNKKRAREIFGKINQLPIESEERNRLFTHSVIAFEGLRYKEQLDALEDISPENLETFSEIFGHFDEIEASLYYQITRERILVIKALEEKVSDDANEKIIQTHLFNHLWLLDPMWERASETPYMEKTVAKEFDVVNAGLSEEEKRGRLDIKYKSTSGSHIIVELKKASVKIRTSDLIDQVDKYRRALMKCLNNAEKQDEPIEIVCVLGQNPIDFDDDTNREMLKPKKIRVVLYGTLIDQAQQAYSQYLEQHKEAGRLTEFIEKLKNSDL